MAFSAVLTGTGVTTTLTSGANTFTLGAADVNILVGSTMQGTGIPAGTKVLTIAGTAGTMSNNATASGAQSIIYSSKFGSILTVTVSGATDYFTPQDIVTAGFGALQGTRELYFVGGLKLQFVVSLAGGVFDFLDWTIETGTNGWLQFDQTSLGEFRSGYLVNGTQFIKTAGFTYYYTNFNGNSAGGTGLFTGTGTGTMTGLFRMHNPRFIERSGSNSAAIFSNGRSNLLVENMVLDYSGDPTGANAGIGGAFGTLKNTYLVKTNGSFSSPNSPNFVTVDGLFYVGNYQSSPQHKFGIPNNYTLDKYSPNVLSSQFLGGFSANTTENYSNPDFSTAGWGLSDMATKFLGYSGWNIRNWSRLVSFQFNDASSNALTGVTLYIKGSDSVVLNAVQAGDYSQNTIGLTTRWNAPYFVYRQCENFTDNIAQVAQVRKYGYITQSTSYSIDKNPYSQPFFMLADASLSGISEATASALTNVFIDWVGKSIWVTANGNYDNINARIAYEFALPAQSGKTDPRTITGKNLVLASGWSVNVMPSIALTNGANITYIYADSFKAIDATNIPSLFNAGGVLQSNGVLLSTTILGVQAVYSGVGSILGLYANSTGTSMIWTAQNVLVGSTLCVWDSLGNTKYLQAEVTTAGVYNYYIPAGLNDTYSFGLVNFSYKPQFGSFAANTGAQMFFTPTWVPDVGITDTKANVAAYTEIITDSKFYNAYALAMLTEQIIKLGNIVQRDGTAISVSAPYSRKLKASNASNISVLGNVIFQKGATYSDDSVWNNNILVAPATFTADTNELIFANVEDGNGNSSVSVLGGDDLGYQLWKVPSSLPVDGDYTTGTLLNSTIVKGGKFRFIGVTGFDIVGIDLSSKVERRCSMSKGIYSMSFYVGGQIQLADDAPQLVALINDILALQNEVDEIKGTGFVKDTHSMTNIKAGVVSMIAGLADVPANVWGFVTRTLTSQGASGATLAEIEASTVLAKEATAQAIKAKTDVLVNAPTLSAIEASAVLAKKTDVLSVPDAVWESAERTLTTAAGLTPEQIATLNETHDSTLHTQTVVDGMSTISGS